MRFRKLNVRETRPSSAVERRQRVTKTRRKSRILFTVLVLLTGAACVAYWIWSSQWILTRGRVVASTVAIAATKTGRLTDILVTEGESVLAGQLVARLDQSELKARRKEAQAHLAEAKIEFAAAKDMGLNPDFQSEILEAESEQFDANGKARSVQAQIEAMATDLAQARINMERAERLFLLQVITRPEWELAAQRHRSIEAEVKVLKTELKTNIERASRIDGMLDLTRENLIREKRAQEALLGELEQQVVQATERVAVIDASFELSEIVASQDGVVTWIYAQPGEVVDHNDTLVVLVDEGDRWIEAYVEADDLTYVKAGQRAVISFKGAVAGSYEGRVVKYVSRYENLKAKPRVGPDQVRTPMRLGRVAHPVRIAIDEELPADIREEMIASVRIKK